MPDPFTVVEYGPPDLGPGPSFGNLSCFVRTDSQGELDGLWVPLLDRWYFGHSHVEVYAFGDLLEVKQVFFIGDSLLVIRRAPLYKGAVLECLSHRGLPRFVIAIGLSNF